MRETLPSSYRADGGEDYLADFRKACCWRCWAALGAVFAAILSRGLVAFLTTEDNRMFVGLGVDWQVLGFAAGMAIVMCVLFGLAPPQRATRVAPASVMRAGGRE